MSSGSSENIQFSLEVYGVGYLLFGEGTGYVWEWSCGWVTISGGDTWGTGRGQV